jgi:hypothetical protein
MWLRIELEDPKDGPRGDLVLVDRLTKDCLVCNIIKLQRIDCDTSNLQSEDCDMHEHKSKSNTPHIRDLVRESFRRGKLL